ncbi:MAG: toast rack family protein [Terriglobia bacterium]
MTGSLKVRVLCAVFAASLLAMSCHHGDEFTAGPSQTESRSVKLGGAQSVQVAVKMGAGDLKLGGGAADLLDADFTYSSPRLKPEVDYNVQGAQGKLEIRQPEGSGGPHRGGQYTWDLHLNDKVPLELRVDLGAGKSDLSLGSLSITKLDVNMGVGETIVDLTGDWKNDIHARIHGGVGQATVKLPRDVGVRVQARGGIGEIRAGDLRKDGDIYTNDAYGKSSVTLDVEVEGGIGQINLEFGGPPPVV